ncbi:MAG TPA: PQQ-dependent sugar dehydrogenase [Myxococcaceae bacterium]|nr:PQQ-dependent sugar dehydrogenase [Myxococcaceae bacterium]
MALTRSVLLLSLLPWVAAAATPSASRGEALFRTRCALCHTVDPGGGGAQGPNLRGVVGRKAGCTDFGYSAAFGRWGRTWTPGLLEKYLAAPGKVVPGTTMVVQTPNAGERADLVAYLATLKAQAAHPVIASGPDAGTGTGRPTSVPDGGTGAVLTGAVLTGAAAFGDWRSDAPGVRRLVRVEDLPPPFATSSAHNSPRIVPRPADARLRVPDGWRVDLFAEGLEAPRQMRVAPGGDVFIAETAHGRIRVLRARDGATRAEQRWTFADGLDGPFGMAFHPPGGSPQWLYVAENNRVIRFPYRDGDTTARGRPEVVVRQLAPTSGGHTTRDVVFSLDGKRMFVSVGSQSNAGEWMGTKSPEEVRAWEASRGLGATWSFEERRADVLVFEPGGGEGRIFATGLRNCVGMAVQPATGDLWCSTNERDGLGDDLVPDYVTRVREGATYGWPWYWLGNVEEPRLKGQRPDLAGKATVPDVLLQAHSASLGMTFRGTDGFAAEHGSWNRERRTGYKVIRIPTRDGVPTGEYEDFLVGFVVDGRSVWGRPVGVAVAHDGALLVTEDAGGTVWRVANTAP